MPNAAPSRTILCNPGYGNGPYVRCMEVALAVKKRLEGFGREPCRIVMPLLYGDRQRRILREEFREQSALVFDETLGDLLRPLFYDGGSYADFLRRWLASEGEAAKRVQAYVARAHGGAVLEIARAPLVATGVRPACVTGFARISRILDRSREEDAIRIDRQLLTDAVQRMQRLEERYDRHFLTEPGTFALSQSDRAIPPTMTLPDADGDIPQPSIYVTVSGIAGTERLCAFATSLGLPVYANDPARIPGARSAEPRVLRHPNIKLHVARAGWGAIWSTLLSGVPLVTMPYDTADDPEIFFNIRRLEELGLGLIYRGQATVELLAEAHTLALGIERYRESLRKAFGTLDGATYAAEMIVTDLLRA